MISAIVNQLKTGSITSVIPFSTIDRPEPPYIVVKSEKAPFGIGYNIRIIVHMLPDQEKWLEDYVRNNLSVLLSEFQGISHNGARFDLDKGITEFSQTVTNNDDGTISQERVFLAPSVLF